MSRRSHLSPAVRFLLACIALLLASAAPGSAGTHELAREIDSVLSSGGRSKARVGIHVVALRSGRVIYRRNATDILIAASNQKLITAAVALEELGPDYFFKTEVFAAGPVSDGVLRGDLVIRGGGDPTIGGRYDDEDALEVFGECAEVLAARGIERIAGDVVADDRFFDQTHYHPDWSEPQAWKWYFPTTGALSVNDNCVMVTVKPGAAPGDPARLSASPQSAPVEFDNRCTTSGRRHTIWFERRPASRVIKVGGYVGSDSDGYSHRVTLRDPALYTARTLRQALESAGIPVEGAARRLRPGESYDRGDAVFLRRTALVPVLRKMVRRSHNHYAEQVWKTVGAETSGVGSWEAGTARAAAMLRRMGFRAAEFSLADGSGLSRENRVSPALLTTLLTRMRLGEHGEVFASLLPAAGMHGTLDDRLDEPPYAGNVRAKTGYLNGVGALSGYATTRGGIEVVFSILVNDRVNPPGTYSMRRTVDPICRAIVDNAG